MSKQLEQVVAALERTAPLGLAAEWDNVGLLLEPPRARRVNTILLTIDLTEAVLDEAIAAKAELIVAYHPPIFEPLRRLLPTVPMQRVILRAIAKQMAVYSPHTALDAVPGGVNDWLVELLCGKGARNACVIEPAVTTEQDVNAGQGRALQLDRPVKLTTFVQRLKKKLGVKHASVATAARHRRTPIQTVALCPGAGASVIANGGDVDVLLTGEMRHHDVLDAVGRGKSVVLTGHTNTERGYLPVLKRLLARQLAGSGQGVKIVVSRRDRHPLEGG